MTLRADIASDLGTIFELGDLAQAANFYPAGSTPAILTGIPVLLSTAVDQSGAGRERIGLLHVRVADLASPELYSMVDVGAVTTYTVAQLLHYVETPTAIPATMWWILPDEQVEVGLCWRLMVARRPRFGMR